MLCCLIGGGLVALLARSARHADRPHNPLLAYALGLGGGLLLVELIITALSPFGGVDVTGPLVTRIALLAGPAAIATAAARAGATGSLLSRTGTTAVTVAAVAGALLAEEADLQLLTLNSAPGVVAGVAAHGPAFVLAGLGLIWRRRCDGADRALVGESCGDGRVAPVDHDRGVQEPGGHPRALVLAKGEGQQAPVAI
jgi:hypothetical protein